MHSNDFLPFEPSAPPAFATLPIRQARNPLRQRSHDAPSLFGAEIEPAGDFFARPAAADAEAAARVDDAYFDARSFNVGIEKGIHAARPKSSQQMGYCAPSVNVWGLFAPFRASNSSPIGKLQPSVFHFES